MSAPRHDHHDSPAVGPGSPSSSCSGSDDEELSTDLLALTPTKNTCTLFEHSAAVANDDAAAATAIPSSPPPPQILHHHHDTNNICNKSYAATLQTRSSSRRRRSNTTNTNTSEYLLSSPFTMTTSWHPNHRHRQPQPKQKQSSSSVASDYSESEQAAARRSSRHAKASLIMDHPRTYCNEKCHHTRPIDSSKSTATTTTTKPKTAAAAAPPYLQTSENQLAFRSSSSLEINNNDISHPEQTEGKPRRSSGGSTRKKKRPLQLILDEKIRQRSRHKMMTSRQQALLASSPPQPPSPAAAAAAISASDDRGRRPVDLLAHHPDVARNQEVSAEARAAESATINNTNNLPISILSEMIIVGHRRGVNTAPRVVGVHDNDDDYDYDDNDDDENTAHDERNTKQDEDEDEGEEEEVLSPLTCPPSQPPAAAAAAAWGEGEISHCDRRRRDDDEEEEWIVHPPAVQPEMEDKREKGTRTNDDVVTTDRACVVYSNDKPISSSWRGVEKEHVDDVHEETRRRRRRMDEDANGPTKEQPKPPPPGKGPGLVFDYAKAVLLGGRAEHGEENDNNGEYAVRKGGRGRAQAEFRSTRRSRNEEGNAIIIGTTRPPSSNAVTVAHTRSIIRKGRGEATALALAAEYEESSAGEDDADDDQVNKKQRGTKRKVEPTALALAEYDETGEIDSYFDNSRAAEERKRRLLALATCMEEEEAELKAGCNNEKEDAIAVPGELSCASEEKQSEPLLSPTIPDKTVTEARASTARKSSISEMVCALRHEFDEMGKALLCPICQSTLKTAIILPCVHAFCKACLKDYYNPTSMKSAVGARSRKKKRKDVSPPRKPKAECPVCKTANPGKRSGEAAPHLDELARAYKLMGRSFSFAPIKYTENVLMTQLEPDEDDVVGGSRHEDQEAKVQHLQVAKVVHGAFVEQTEVHQSQHSSFRPISFKEKMKVNRYQMMAKEQEAVVRADEQVLSRVARGVRGMKQMVNAVKTVFVGKTEASRTSKVDLAADAKDASALTRNEAVSTEGITAVANSSAVIEQHVGNERFSTESKSLGDDDIQDKESTSGDDEFFSSREESRDDSQSRYSTAGEDIQYSSCLSLTAINDGNIAQNAHQPELLCPPTKRSPRGASERNSEFLRETQASTAVEITTGSSPLVFHDGNTVRKPCNQQKSYHGLSFLQNHFDHTSNSKSPENVLALAPAALQVQNLDENNSKVKAHDVVESISVGSIVFVQARTWPGINKPGGYARVTKVHPSSDTGYSTKFDVAYVLGGKEKGVDESFVTFNVNELSTIEESPESQKKIRQRRNIVKSQIKASPPNAPSFPVYCDEELKNIPEDVLQWAGILPKKKGKVQHQQKQATGTAPIKKAMKSVKRALMQSNTVPNNLPSIKKRKLATDTRGDAKSLDKHDGAKSLKEIISSLSNDEIVTRADSRYSALLSSFEKQSSSDPQMVLHAVTSSLSDSDLELLDSFRKFLKGKSVVLKLMKDFNPDKTQICITAVSPPSSDGTPSEPIDVVSSSRTLKIMRSALIGIPILTPAWMEACLKEGCIVSPTGTMCIRSLPRKQSNAKVETTCQELPKEQFGVAKYAAAFQESELSPTNHVLNGFSVLLCGESASSGMMKDLTVLLTQAGASVLSSSSTACRVLTEMLDGKAELRPILFLCDDSPMDESCGISDALFEQAEKLLTGKCRASVHCVAFTWLFDSIGCATPLQTEAYEPAAPRARALWKLATTNRDGIASTKK